MKKQIVITTLVLLTIATFAISAPLAFAVNNPHIPINQGTSKPSNELPEQAKVPWPTFSIDGDYVEGCRARGGDVEIFVPGQGVWLGGPCCASNTEFSP